MSRGEFTQRPILDRAKKMAEHVVKAWESIPERAHKLAGSAADQTLVDGTRLVDKLEADMRELCGGEETYLACKEFLRKISLNERWGRS